MKHYQMLEASGVLKGSMFGALGYTLPSEHRGHDAG